MASSVKESGKGWEKLKKRLKKASGKEVVVGIPGPISFEGPTTAAIGTVHEFGSTDGTIPERSFLRSTFDRNERKYAKLAEKMASDIAKGKGSRDASLFKLGEIVRGDVINSIRDKLIPQDVKSRPEGAALENTGGLVGSIVSVVRAAKP